MLFRFCLQDRDRKLFELFPVDDIGSFAHQVDGVLVLGEGHDVADALRACHQHCEAVDAIRQSCVRRYAVLESGQEEAELLLRFFGLEADDLEHLLLNVVLVDSDTAAAQLDAVENDIQEKMFEVIGLRPEEAQEKFGFLLTAFKYGVPPHAGLAYGIDRFAMLMTGAESIRDVMAFPKNKDAVDLMSEAPNVVDEKQLEELSIAILKTEAE